MRLILHKSKNCSSKIPFLILELLNCFLFLQILLQSSALASPYDQKKDAGMGCDQIGYLPHNIFVTYANDAKDELVDIHTFNKYFTYQIAKPFNQSENTIQTQFYVNKSAQSEGFVFRLRTELSSAFSEDIQQGMRVTLVDKNKGSILVDGSSLDFNDGTVKLDHTMLEDNTTYILKYEFFQEQLISNQDQAEYQTSYQSSSIKCKLPYITQELLIIDKALLRQRVEDFNGKYKNDKALTDLSKFKCDFSKLNNTYDFIYGEDGLFCQRTEYSYQLSQEQRSSQQEVIKVYEKDFQVRGTKDEVITYWFDITFGYTFISGQGLMVLIQKIDKKDENQSKYSNYEHNAESIFKCLNDKSCTFAKMSGKNELKVEVILTSGLYRLSILEHSDIEMRQFLMNDIGLKNLTFTFQLKSLPVIQNEERNNCPYLYMNPDFIQNKFISGYRGQRFVFSDKVVINVFELQQQIKIKPEVDSIVKIRVKEAFGIQTKLSLANQTQHSQTQFQFSQTGSTSFLFGKALKDQEYVITLDYSNSIIEMSDFFQCPHLNVEFSLISEQEALQMAKKQQNCSHEQDWNTETQLNSIFNQLSGSSSSNTQKNASTDIVFDNSQTVFVTNINQQSYQYYSDSSDDDNVKQNFEFTTRRFILKEKMQLFLEIFYESFLYDLELFLISDETSLVRAHINKQSRPDIEWSLYKGSKSLFTELEAGEYDIKFVMKVPKLPQDLEHLKVDCVQYQLHLIAKNLIDRQQIIPNSLNYLGMLGPNGTNFGQVVYFCDECVIEQKAVHEIFFTIADNQKTQNDLSFDALITSYDNQVGVKLSEVAKDQQAMAKQNKPSNNFAPKRLGKVGQQQVFESGNEESITDSELKANRTYRIQIVNKDFANSKSIAFILRIEIKDKSYQHSSNSAKSEMHPKDINEIMRFKMKPEGLKEGDFLIGTRYIMEYNYKYALQPFKAKSDKVYQGRYKNEKTNTGMFQEIYTFRIDQEEAEVFATVVDFTGVANLGISILKDSEEDEFEINSVPGKYHSYIKPVQLTKGNYVLLIEPESRNYFDPSKANQMIKYAIDFVYVRENFTSALEARIVDTMELCGLPTFPENFNSPQFLHPLSGFSMDIVQEYQLTQLILGTNLRITLQKPSLLIFYLEVPKEISAIVELSKTQSTQKLRAETQDLNSVNDNFLKQKDLSHKSIIQFREFVSEGTYNLMMHMSESDGSYIHSMPRCESFTISMSVMPTDTTGAYSLEDKCEMTTNLGENLRFDKINKGVLRYDVTSRIFDTTYISTAEAGEGPFLFYFQINYDSQVEGALALVLSEYSNEDVRFQQVAQYFIQDQQSLLIAVIEEGTFVLSIQSLSSLPKKYQTSKQNSNDLLRSPCLSVQYTYFVTSLNLVDLSFSKLPTAYDMIGMLAKLFQGDLSFVDEFSENDQQKKIDFEIGHNLRDAEQLLCKFDSVPAQLPESDTGFDISYTFKIGVKNYDLIDIINAGEKDQLLKIYIKSRSVRSNVNAFLYTNSSMTQLLYATDSIKQHKEFQMELRAQKRAYKLKLVYDSIDEKSACPVVDVRIAMKPFQDLVKEELRCVGAPQPPETINAQDDYSLEDLYAFSSQFVDKFKEQEQGISYDIVINTHEKKSYHFDIESKYTFLSTAIDMDLYMQDLKGNFIEIAQSKWYNQDEINYSSLKDDIYTQKDFINRLQVTSTEDDLSQAQGGLSNKYLLRLHFQKNMIKINSFFLLNKYISKQNPSCYNFELSIRVNEADSTNDKSKPEILRIEWPAKHANELFDSRKKLTAFIEFDQSVEEMYKQVKFMPFIYLTEINPAHYQERITTSNVRLSIVDRSSMIITFKHNALKKGTCYNLNIDKKDKLFKYNATLLSNQTKICTTNCLCSDKGMKQCQEETGQCICHYPFAGQDCSTCQQGYLLDQTTQDCVKQKTCLVNGGTEDCNGHGTCFEDQKSGQARCSCDLGFTNDGEELCSKCVDPLFDYPHCMVRNWILEDTNINCLQLPLKMPQQLYNTSYNDKALLVQPYQNSEGVLNWAGRYKLEAANQEKKMFSSHQFMINSPSIFRLYLDTLKSGSKFSYNIYDPEKRIIISSDNGDNSNIASSYIKNEQLYMILKPTNQLQNNNVFTLELEFEYEKSMSDHNWCPLLEVYMIVQPFEKLQNYLKCTAEELTSAQSVKQYSWQLGSKSQFINEQFTMNSNMLSQQQHEFISLTSENFLQLKYQIRITQSGNAISIITSYVFATNMVSMSLVNVKTGNIIAIEKDASLEDIQPEIEGLSTENDMISFIEKKNITEGEYELLILIRKGMFLPTQQFQTCLNFDLTIEYIVTQQESSYIGNRLNQDQFLNQVDEYGHLMYQIVSVFPAQMKNLKESQKQKIDIQFNQELNIDNLVSSINDLHYLCHMVSTTDSKQLINPYQVMLESTDTISLFFNFKNSRITEFNSCYYLKCSTNYTKQGHELILPLQIETQYCFSKSQAQLGNTLIGNKCNPNSYFKIVDNKCQCTYPYKGEYCNQCESSYIAKTELSGHTICVLDDSKCSEAICNNHGQCLKPISQVISSGNTNEMICKCDQDYDGKLCNVCKNQNLLYPDCKESQNGVASSDIYDAELDKEYLQRRQYNIDGYDHRVKQRKFEQCPFNNYPKNLDAVEYMQFIGGGLFHVANYYTVNHDADNIIEFKPREEGVFKIFIQQPEDAELVVNDEAFDLEVAIFDQKNLLASSMNHHLDLGSHIDGKQEYISLTYEVSKSEVNKTLQIVFRAVNFSLSANEDFSNCQSLYIEMEFAKNFRQCQYQTMPDYDDKYVQVTSYSDYSHKDINKVYSVNGERKHFIYHQDYYLGDLNSEEQELDEEFELKISIQQKFLEKNQIDFLVEVIKSDTDKDDINDREMQYYFEKPQCKDICVISGQKAYNEMHNNIVVMPKTYLRLWLFQSVTDGTCANFQFFLNIGKIKKEQTVQTSSNFNKLNSIKCEELDMPESLNVQRYLGDDQQEQQNFHFMERFRVDNIKANNGFKIKFRLSEPTMVRFAAPVHKHIEFDLELRETIHDNSGKLKSRQLIQSVAKDFEDSIFAQLDAGTYYLKLIFVSPEFYLNQHCQTIQLELAMSKINELKHNLISVNNKNSDFKLQNVLENSNRKITIQKQKAIQTFSINKKADYSSYVTLGLEKFYLPKYEEVGIVMFTQSEFLLNDVNFALTHLETQTISHNLKRESTNSLVIENLREGTYELLIYVHNCFTNINDRTKYLENIDVSYQIDFNFIRWQHAVDDLLTKFMVINLGDAARNQQISYRAPLDSFHPYEIKCFMNSYPLPDIIQPQLVQSVDIDNYFMISQVGSTFTHTITYTASKGQDYLRIVIDRANTRILLGQSNGKGDIIESFRVNDGEVQVLQAYNIKEGVQYDIVIEFGIVENFIVLEQQLCSSFKLQLKSSSSQLQCKKSKNSNADNNMLTLPQMYQQGVFELVLKDSKSNRIVKNIEIEGKNEEQKSSSSNKKNKQVDVGIDLELSLDFSNEFFIASLQLYNTTKAGPNVLSQKNYQLVEQYEINAREIVDDIKNLVKYRFSKLTKGKYELVVTFIQKPQQCDVKMSIEYETLLPIDQIALLERDQMGNLAQYEAQNEIMDFNRYVESLPISLDTVKYLKDEDYILISEYIQLSSDKDKNKMTFTLTQNNTLLKLYVEHKQVLLALKDLNDNGKIIMSYKTNNIIGFFNQSRYEISFDFFTDLMKEQVLNSEDKIHITIVIAKQDVYKNQYRESQGERITHCEQNKNFPLSLNKNLEKTRSEEDMVYEYPLLRLSSDILSAKFVTDTYSFRFNETTRFYFSLGMHFLTSHLILQLTDLRSYGQETFGKQSFNLNEIDMILPPGDYAMTISQPSIYERFPFSDIAECGLYSMNGHITPLSQLGSQGNSNNLKSTLSKCAIKEVAPFKIYGSESETKAGGEFFVNTEGSFFRYFEDILYKKSAASYVNPEYERIQFAPKEDAYLGLLMQYKQKGNQPIIKLHNQFGFEKYEEPLYENLEQSAGQVEELNIVFKLQQGHSYILYIFYGGEVTFDQDGQESCEYYELAISISHISYLLQEFKCIDSSTYKRLNTGNFLKDLPQSISEKDLNSEGVYTLNKFMELKYPQDYEKLQLSKDDSLISKVIDVQLQTSKYDISTSAHFNYPEFNVGIKIYEIISSPLITQSGQAQQISEQLALTPLQGNVYDPTLIRHISAKQIEPKKLIMIEYFDKYSKILLDNLVESLKGKKTNQDFCLYFDFKLKIKKQLTNQQQAALTLISSITPEMETNNPLSVGSNTKQLVIGIEFTQQPYINKQQANGQMEQATLSQLQDLIMLKFQNPSRLDNNNFYYRKAISIQQDKKQNHLYTFIFDITQEQQKQKNTNHDAELFIDIGKLFDSKGKKFEISKDIEFMPKFEFAIEKTEPSKKREAEENMSDIDQKIQKAKEEIAIAEEEVKCLCVHGWCNKKSSLCAGCDKGWEGTLCDMKKSSTNINNKDIQDGKIGKRMRRNRKNDEEDDIQVEKEEKKASTSSSANKQDRNQQQYLHNQQKDSDEEEIQQKDDTSQMSIFTQMYTFTEDLLWTIVSVVEVLFIIIAVIAAAIFGWNRYNQGKGKKKYRPISQLERDDSDDDSPKDSLELTEFQSRSKSSNQGPQLRTLSDKNITQKIQEYRQQQEKSQQQTSNKAKTSASRLNEQDEDEETQKLQSELMLYSQFNEQDQDQMMHNQSPEQHRVQSNFQQNYDQQNQQLQQNQHQEQQQLEQEQQLQYQYGENQFEEFQDFQEFDQYQEQNEPQQQNEIDTVKEIDDVLNEMKDFEDEQDADENERFF